MKKVGVAVIGTGLLGARHARVYAELPNAELVAVMDVHAERAKAVAAKHGVAWYASYKDLLGNPDVEAVSVATPDHLHRDAVVACLEAGKHVLTEKPLSTKVEDAEAMLRAATGTDRRFIVNFSQRFLAEYAWIKRTIEAGHIGMPLMVQSLKHEQISVPTNMIRSWASETSPIFFMTSHDMDLIHWYLGSEPVEVTSYATSRVLSGAGFSAPDGVQAVVKHAAGETVLYHSSWFLPATFPTLTDSVLEILGEQGVIYLQSRNRQAEIYSDDLNQKITFTGPATATEQDGILIGAFRSSLDLFLNSVVTGEEAMTSAANTLTVAALEYALHESFDSGQSVSVSRYLDRLREAMTK